MTYYNIRLNNKHFMRIKAHNPDSAVRKAWAKMTLAQKENYDIHITWKVVKA